MKIKKYILYLFISVLVFHCTNINVRAAEVAPIEQEQVNKTEEVSNTKAAAAEEVKEAGAVKEVEAVKEAEVVKDAEAIIEVEAVKEESAVKTVKVDKQVKKEVKKYTAAELRLLSAIIYCEANSEKYNGKLAVGIVVMNRVRSSIYPDTVKEVIYQKSQFGPARSGSLKKALEEYDKGNFTSDTEKECIKAAKTALNGVTSITASGKKKNFSKFLYFSGRVKGYTFQLGNHQFK